jgi:hypothetical protein
VKARSTAEAGIAATSSLPPRGRAARSVCAGGEIWTLPRDAEPIADRLASLGSANVGGFVDGGSDGASVWLLRRIGQPLDELMRARNKPWAWRAALEVATAIARALAACEQAALSPGPLHPAAVRILDDPASIALPGRDPTKVGRAVLAADALVAALVGDASAAGRAEPATEWTPPEQRAGAPWDAAANRYALALLLYALLAGGPPSISAGEPPPFADEVARALPSGLQSLVLRMLDPEPARRPKRAAAVADELDRFLSGGFAARRADTEPERAPGRARKAASRGGSSPAAHPDSPRRHGGTEPRPGEIRTSPALTSVSPRLRGNPDLHVAKAWLSRLWPIGAGLMVAIAALSLLSPPAPKAKAASIAAAQPLAADQTRAQDCAACHARQAAEWRRSVMAHSVKSPLFNSLESLIEEQVGRDADCPNGAGILRKANSATACRDRKTGVTVTGSGGEHWCVNCHSPSENLAASMPAWDGRAGGDRRSRHPVRDLLGERPIEGISCGFCHQVHGPVGGRGGRGYQGNPTWTSFVTGAVFASRPEDARGLFGIANSGYELRPEEFLLGRASSEPAGSEADGPPLTAHRRPSASARAYLRSSEFCGSCHDVRLFGTDTLGASKGEHFKRLRNAYSEWSAWAAQEKRAGRTAASCQDCHMSTYPGVCERVADDAPANDGPSRPSSTAGARDDAPRGDPECPPGFRFVARQPGALHEGRVADNSAETRDVGVHYFSGVDVPLSREFPEALIDEAAVDLAGVPLSARRRRDLLLRHTFQFTLGSSRRSGGSLEIPVEIINTGAGHRVPAGFSQEREFWVHLLVRDGDGRVLYEVGRVDRNDEDLRDKVFARIGMDLDRLDRQGRPEGVFGADVRDGPDVPLWNPSPLLGGSNFRGKGLINFQNGFLRCVRCIGTIDSSGACQPLPGQEQHRADRFVDGDYDIDTGECRSNLTGLNALFETYFPVGALDASRGITKGPDSIIDTRSAPPSVPIRYTYDLPTSGRRGPFRVEARLMFRAFPPFLVRGFIAYERAMAARGLRPSGPLVTDEMMRRLEVVELSRVKAEVP